MARQAYRPPGSYHTARVLPLQQRFRTFALEVNMLRLQADSVDTLWDLLLPDEARHLPQDLDQIDRLLTDARLLAPFQAHWDRRAAELQHPFGDVGRPTIAMATYLRLMLIKQRMGWGDATL